MYAVPALRLPKPKYLLHYQERWFALLMLATIILQTIVPLFPASTYSSPALPIASTTSTTASGTASPIEALPPAPTYALPDELVGKTEITALRTSHTATYDLGNGDLAMVMDTTALHYQDANGNWLPVNPYFRRMGSRWINNTNTVQLDVDERSSHARVVANAASANPPSVKWQPLALEFAEANGEVTPFALPKSHNEAQPAMRTADGQTVRFMESWSQGLQDQWQSAPGRVEYSMRLNQLPERWFWQGQPDALDLRVRLTLAPGTQLLSNGKPVQLPLETAQELSLLGADGTEMVLLPPRAYEQGAPEEFVSGSYVLDAIADPSVIELRVRTPWQWLAAPERAYPIIIDPVFQVRAPTSIWQVSLDPDKPDEAPKVYDLSSEFPVSVGRLTGVITRALVRYKIPQMPVGTQIDRAYLYALPTDHRIAASNISQSWFSLWLTLHEVTHSNWQGGGQPLEYDPTAIEPGSQLSIHADSTKPRTGVQWDVTTQARKWMVTNPNTPDVNNHGLLLRTTSIAESCNAYLLPGNTNFQDPFCGILFFDTAASSWDETELNNTQDSESADNPTFVPTERGGLRLVVFYHNDNVLQENVPTGIDLNGGGGMPPGEAPYFATDHIYKLPPLSDSYWQAIALRGVGPRQGPEQPQGPGQLYQRHLQGTLNLSLLSANDKLELTSVTPAPGTVGYILFNGAGSKLQTFDQNTILRVGGIQGVEPSSYDIRLISQAGTISTIQAGNTPKAGVQTATVIFDSADPLSLWNIAMPNGSNSRVTITIESDGTADHDFLEQYADDFQIKLVRSDSQVDLPLSAPNAKQPHFGDGADTSIGPLKVAQTLGGGAVRFQSEIFQAQSGQWALAIAYNGPQLTSWTVPDCPDEFCNDPAQVVPIRYRIIVGVHSCSAGQFPTSGGQCQVVECPTAADFPFANYVEAGGFGLWSGSGWLNAGGDAMRSPGTGGIAPFIGPPASSGIRQAPTVAIIGGDITYNKTPNPDTISISSSDILLVKCQPPSANNKNFEYFQVYQGAMSFSTNLFLPSLGERINFVDPWQTSDRTAGDINSEFLSLRPLEGTFNGQATLRRQTGFDAVANTTFLTQWSVTYNGWLGLQAGVSLNNSQPLERIGSLTLSLGSSFSLDVPNAVDKFTARRFASVRASAASVTQDARLGGASKGLQAVFLPRGVPIPSEPSQALCPRSCIDLRSPSEVFGQPINRSWDMPDVHTDVQPGTVAFGTPGSMIVHSVDHPTLINNPAALNDFSQSFSFDAYKATVSVTNEPCEAGQAPTLVIRGETRIAMPNLGSTADPNAGITANFKLCETPPDGVGLRSVVLQFESPVGIPIGASGLFLTALGGTVKIQPEGTRIDINVAFQTEPTGPGKVLRATGVVTIDTRGLFAFKGEARLLGVFNTSGTLWVAWNPLDIGFDIKGGFEDWLYGRVTAHMWRGRGWNNYTWLADNNDMHFTASIEATLQIPQGAVVDWGPVIIPPGDISLSVALEFGEFCTNNSCTTYEWGIKGSFTIVGEEVGLYYGFDEGLDFILGNDDHILIDQYGGAQSAPVMAASVDMSDVVNVLPGPAAVNGTTLIPLSVSNRAESFMVVLGWQAGTPLLSLIDPDGVEITLENAAQHQVQTHSTPESAFMTVTAPKSGVWQAKIANLSDAGVEHYKLVYLANKGQPGTPGNRGSILLPAVQNEAVNNGQYNITWQVPEDTPDQATIALYYRRTEVITGNLQIDVPIVRNLPAKTGSYLWDTSRMLVGNYQIKAVIDDGINELPSGKVSIPQDTCVEVETGLPRQRAFDPLRFPGIVQLLSTGTVQVVDTTAPNAPSALTLNPTDDAIYARWEGSNSPDVAAYQIVWGPKDDGEPNGFALVNQALVTVGGELIYRIGAVSPGIEYGVHVLAIDVNGNASAPTATKFAQPGAGGNPIPSTPVNLTRVDRTSTSASFTWEAGAGPAPAGYRVTYTRLGVTPETKQVDVTQPNVTLSDLQTGAYYAVRVAAFNSDGWLSTATEAAHVSITNGVDSNGDGLADDWANAFGVSGGNADPDGDGLSNVVEQEWGSYPNLQDSDGDGLSDGEEQLAGTAWYDSLSYDTYLHPRLAISDDKLRFRAKLQPGGEAAPQSVSWVNAGAGSLNIVSSSESDWILHSVNGNEIQVGIKTEGLTPGFYSGVVKLGAAPGNGPLVGDPACIRVNAWVLPADNDVPEKLNQVINFPALPNRTLGDAPFAISATASSGLPVSLASNTPEVCALAENVVTLLATGTCTITAIQLGDDTYNPAQAVSRSFRVLEQGQTQLHFIHLPIVWR